ncbi:MAG: PfkB family carbohydrate kinase [Chloroflexi bacterium]|nr:PfkB family carbohydrate kinase [Chloroflexota bacterium]
MTVVCLGEILIDFVAREGGVSVGDAASFQKAMGGAPANVAVGVSRLGGEAAFIGCVGDDPFGQYLASALWEEAVAVSGLQTTTEARTTLAFVSLDAAGERSFIFFRQPGADQLLSAAQLDLALLSRARIFHFGSFSLSGEPAATATRTALAKARAAGAFISFDPNLRLHLWADAAEARRAILPLIDQADLLKLSAEELPILTSDGEARALWRDGLQALIVTAGPRGARLITAEGEWAVPAFAVPTVDTTGAGDAFVAALLARLSERPAALRAAPEETLRFASAAGALATTARGATTAMPNPTEIAALLARN